MGLSDDTHLISLKFIVVFKPLLNVQTLFFASIKILRSNLSGEYFHPEFVAFLETQLTIH